MRILLLDDHADLRETLAEALQLNDFKVIHCDSLSARRVLAATPAPMAVLINPDLRYRKGADLLRDLSSQPEMSGVPIIAVETPFDNGQSTRMWATGSIVVPCPIGDLALIVNESLRRK